MIRTVQRELSATSNVNAPKFNFREYVRGHVYNNNSTDIDFVTDNGNLYVPVSDNVTANKDSAKLDSQFMLLVAKGEQGEQGVKGEKGADGRTPAVYARFDGKQMVFYTNVLDEEGNIVYNDNGTPATRRMAATNDLTGPSWKPELVNDTIVWHKTKDDEAPKSIPLSNLVKQSAPVLLRVNSDNTRRMDEMDESGPANYIQWKYEGDEFWNNLISISELMNLTLAGVSIWQDENDHKWHFGHREVEKASYAASHTGKQIITDVELGEVLYDAGVIPESNYDLEIYQLTQDTCDLKRRVRNIENELPKFVKSVTVNGQKHRPDESGDVTLPDYYTKEQSDDKYQPKGNYQPAGDYAERSEIPSLDGYLKASDLKFRVVKDSSDDHRYLEVSMNGGTTYTRVFDATCACDHEDPTPTVIPVTGVTLNCPDSALVVGTSQTLSYTVAPSNATNKNVTFSSSNTNIATVTNTGRVTPVAAGTARITVTTVDGGKTDSCDITVNNSEPTPVTPTSVEITNCAGDLTVGDTEQLNYRVLPSNADQSVTFSSSNTSVASVSSSGLITAKAAGEATITVSTNTGNKTATCAVVVVNAEPSPVTEYQLILTPGESEISVGECTTITAKLQKKESGSSTWIDVDNVNATYSTTSNRVSIDGNRICGVSAGNSVTINGSYTGQGISASGKTVLTVTSVEYTLTIDENGGSVQYKIGNYAQQEYTRPLTLDAGDEVVLTASRDGYHVSEWQDNSSDSTPLTPSNNNFTMIKNTSIKVIWEENLPDTYTVSTSLDTTCGDENKADHIYISTSKPVGTDTSISNLSGHNIIHVVAKKQDYEDKEWSEEVESTTIIKLDSTHGGCTWTPATVPCETTVDLGMETLNLTVGETFTFDNPVTTTGDCQSTTATWADSDDGAIATVDENGKVTGIYPGHTTITASANGKSDTCEVTVTSGTISVTGVSLDQSTASLTYASCIDNDTLKLTATITPSNATNQSLSWESSETGVASIVQQIDNYCTIKPNGVGNSTITVTTEDGEYTATCLLTVTAAEVPLENLYFVNSTVELGVGETQYVAAVKTPSCATSCNNIGFTSSDTSVVSFTAASDGYRALLTGVSAGTAVITAACGNISTTCTVTVTASTPTKATIYNDTGVTIYVDCPGDGSEDWILTNGSSRKFEFGTGAITVKVNDEDIPIDNKLFTSSEDCDTYNSDNYSIASGSATIPNSDLITVCDNDTTIKLSFEQEL